MTAVERQSTPIAFMAERQAESPTSRFTAVNVGGRDNAAALPSQPPANRIHNREGDERQNGQPRVSPPGQEKLSITTQGAQQEEPPVANGVAASRPSPPSNQVDSTASHKRKRSGSVEAPIQNGQPPHTQALQTPSKEASSPQSPPATRDTISAAPPAPPAPPKPVERSSYANVQPPAYQYPSHENPEAARAQWYAQQSQQSHEHTPVRPQNTEDQLFQALARESQGGSNSPLEYATSPGDNSYHDGYDNRSLTQVQQDERKKRKRNFSNRTKTGCMTCRRRKKKCDELRPECNNCLRGGFVCNGYPSKATWTKPGPGEAKPAPIPLQAKDGIDPSSPAQALPAYGQPPVGYQMPPAPQKREPLPSYRGQQPPRVDTQQPPSHHALDDRMSVLTLPSANSPDTRIGSAVSYSQPSSSPFPTPVSAHPGTYGSHAQDIFKGRQPSLYREPDREVEMQTPQSAHPPSMTRIDILNPTTSSSPHPLTQATSVQDAARLALSHPASRTQSQKQEMLNGSKFYPFDKELVLERERCAAACYRFNTLSNPNNGVGPEERSRIFRDILQPKTDISLSPTERSSINLHGRVGRDVVVEAPFSCDYGYNINIGDAVAIGKNCTILDTSEVKIGDRCVLGPNVSIYTEFLQLDPQKRMGNRGPHQGISIVIEDDCWIGGGVTILPGTTVRRGATVGAGSVVTRDVPQHTVVCGNPARVIRRLYPSE